MLTFDRGWAWVAGWDGKYSIVGARTPLIASACKLYNPSTALKQRWEAVEGLF
jgi:hypothetical protein